MIIRKILSSFRKQFVFFIVIVITFILKENYPLSFYPMYNNFPNWSYTFYFQNEKGEVYNSPSISHADLSHLYYAECQKQKIPYGYGIEPKEQLHSIGVNLIRQIFSYDTLKAHRMHRITLFRIHNYIKNGEVISDTLEMASNNGE